MLRSHQQAPSQIDLLLIGPSGMFLIQAKAWRGSYKAYRDTWHQREGNRWVPVSSPTEQVQRQARKLGQYRKIQLEGSPTYYLAAVPAYARDDDYQVAVTMLSHMGNVASS